MFIYGSILMDVTLRPVVLRSNPVEDAIQMNLRSGPKRERLTEILTYDTLPDTAYNPSRYKNIFGHFGELVCSTPTVAAVLRGQRNLMSRGQQFVRLHRTLVVDALLFEGRKTIMMVEI
jgi:hypothetical protein